VVASTQGYVILLRPVRGARLQSGRGRVKIWRCFASGGRVTLHPWEGRCRAPRSLWVYLLKRSELQKPERSTALAALAPALSVYLLKTKAGG
jgi:hypothetical protein